MARRRRERSPMPQQVPSRQRKEARLRGPLRRCRCVFVSTATTMMNAGVMGEANRLEIDAGNAGCDIQSGLSLQADRLQRIGVARPANQEVAATADADRRI